MLVLTEAAPDSQLALETLAGHIRPEAQADPQGARAGGGGGGGRAGGRPSGGHVCQ